MLFAVVNTPSYASDHGVCRRLVTKFCNSRNSSIIQVDYWCLSRYSSPFRQISEIGKELNASRKPLFLSVTENVEGLEGSCSSFESALYKSHEWQDSWWFPQTIADFSVKVKFADDSFDGDEKHCDIYAKINIIFDRICLGNLLSAHY